MIGFIVEYRPEKIGRSVKSKVLGTGFTSKQERRRDTCFVYHGDVEVVENLYG